MGIFSRMSDIINSNINAMLDAAEDPEKIVRLMIQEMEDTLVEVRSAAARGIADKKEISRKAASLASEATEWASKAELAVTKGRDDLAKAALREKKDAEAAAAAMGAELSQVDNSLQRLNTDIARLQVKLNDAKARQKALLLRHDTATKQLRVRKQLNDGKLDDALVRFEQFERKMDNLEGRVEAYDVGKKADLKQEISNLEDEEQIEQALDNLKKRLSNKTASSDA
jgi:phage shock protein A